jgi:hypothetical protein
MLYKIVSQFIDEKNSYLGDIPKPLRYAKRLCASPPLRYGTLHSGLVGNTDSYNSTLNGSLGCTSLSQIDFSARASARRVSRKNQLRLTAYVIRNREKTLNNRKGWAYPNISSKLPVSVRNSPVEVSKNISVQ